MRQEKKQRMDSSKLIESIESDLSNLRKRLKLENPNLVVTHEKFEKIHRELFELESIFMRADEKALNHVDIGELMIKKKLIIKDRKKISSSFVAWIFNNYDL